MASMNCTHLQDQHDLVERMQSTMTVNHTDNFKLSIHWPTLTC